LYCFAILLAYVDFPVPWGPPIVTTKPIYAGPRTFDLTRSFRHEPQMLPRMV